jgi:NAD(P)H-flavin reductase/ferredoxin
MIIFDQESYTPQENESVLDCLLRHGVSAPHSCCNGICQTCLMRAVKGNPTNISQKGLKQSYVSQNYFLACTCYPDKEMEIVLPNTQRFHKTTTVIDKTFLSDSVLRLRLKRPEDYHYFAGQFLTIYKTETIGRSYSLASIPESDNYLEFHIHLLPNGQVSQWLAYELAIDAPISISEAIGDCIYLDSVREKPLLLVGTGTGIAPLIGITKQAIFNEHKGNIRIYHGVRKYADLYLDEQLKSLATQHPNIEYVPCVTQETNRSTSKYSARHGRANDLAIEGIPDLKGWAVYLCGNPDMVNSTKRKMFLSGASLQDIYSDPYIYS